MEIFTYDWLRGLYEKMKEKASVVPVCEWKGRRAIVLGHDIDYSVRKAHDLYLLEREMGIRSTFFVLTTALSYNILDPENRKRLREMVESGYEIGLHFNISVYEDRSFESLRREVAREATILNVVTDSPVRSICLHSPGLVGIFPSFPGYINTSDFWNKIPILVDSCMDFKGVDPFEFVEKVKDGAVALWLHPEHYEGGKSPRYHEVFAYDFCDLVNRVDSWTRVNRTFRKQIGGSSLARKIKERIL